MQQEQSNQSSEMFLIQVQYRGMVATASGIIREEGAMKLWYGSR